VHIGDEVTEYLTPGNDYYINNTRFTAVELKDDGRDDLVCAAPPIGTTFYCEEIGGECKVTAHQGRVFHATPVKRPADADSVDYFVTITVRALSLPVYNGEVESV
jgi:hypothetical protein